MTSYVVAFIAAASGLLFWQRRRLGLANLGRFLIRPSEIAALISGGQTDKALSELRLKHGDPGAFNRLYAEHDDPWRLGDPANRYQQRKYRTLLSLLPSERKFESALDAGCGIGYLTRLLAERVGHVAGVDVSASAIERAKEVHKELANVEFSAIDICNLPPAMDGTFDLVVLADVLYYFPPGALAKTIAERIARLLRPGGYCAIVNHHFIWDQPTRASRRIYAAFESLADMTPVLRHWAPFFLVTILKTRPRDATEPAG